tara:strand:+ start:464 stop:733 length:270 start_codon:yes stop_codon:yes gene_type:complete
VLAGPGSISFLIGLNEEYSIFLDQLVIVLSILIVCFATFLVLRSAPFIVKWLEASGINAISRIIGFIVIAIGIEYISSSVMTVLGVVFR